MSWGKKNETHIENVFGLSTGDAPLGFEIACFKEMEWILFEVWRMNPRRGKPVSIAPCVLCEVTIIDFDQWGVWGPKCHRSLKLKWS